MKEEETKENYFKAMHFKDRVIVFCDNDSKIKATISYFISDNLEQLHRQDIWSIPKENIEGKFICLDRLVTDKKLENFSLIIPTKKMFFKMLKEKYPDKIIVWINRRRKNAIFA